jgi:hypothetical protein
MSGSMMPQTPATQTPMGAQQSSYFQSMTPEQLQETALRLGSSPQGQMAQRILAQKRIMGANQPAATPEQPAAANLPQSYSDGGTARGGAGFASGGSLNTSTGGVDMSERGISSGFMNGATGGRTDNANINPQADSYVLPADVVSGLGEGNSLAGARAIQEALSTGPHGVPLPSARGNGMGMPARHLLPAGSAAGGRATGQQGFAAGGDVPRVPIVAASGEYIINAEQVRAIGRGDVGRGHRILDAFVKHVRGRTIKEMGKLKGPVKD